MTVDYTSLSTQVFAIDGCTTVAPPAHGNGPVINVDANFVVPEDLTGQDLSFHRIEQMRAMLKAAKGFGPISPKKLEPQGPRRPHADHFSEWKKLKKAISLASNEKVKLANRKVAEGTSEYYAGDPLSGPTDWFFRFSLKFLGPKHAVHFKAIVAEILDIFKAHDCKPFLEHYAGHMVQDRFARYREIYTDYFSKYSQFAQVSFQTGLGLAPSSEMVATSVQFDQVKSFYGDAYEVFAGSIDFFAMLNNVKQGRAFDEFATMNMKKYQSLDNPSKFKPFAANPVFTALCEEKDNHLRNASHHKGIRIDPDGRTLRYRSGKGGNGPEQEMTYASYLHRSVTLFFQISVLAAVELTICSDNKIDLPFD